jgi:hypothetical protein
LTSLMQIIFFISWIEYHWFFFHVQ